MADTLKVIAGTSNMPLARRIADHLGIQLTQAVQGRFRDGEIHVRITENIRGGDLFVVQSTNPPAENLLEMLVIMDAARRASAARITAVIPYFGYARQDRKDMPRVPITSKLMANLITVAGANRVLTIDLHAPQIQGFFDIPTDHLFTSNIFFDAVKVLNPTDLVVVSPDVGSIKMARTFAKRWGAGLAVVDKRRVRPNVAEAMDVIGDVEGKDVIIRDDIIDTGGTIANAAFALRKRGAKTIVVAVTHALLSGEAPDILNDSPIDRMLMGDTVQIDPARMRPKFEAVSVARLLAQAILRIHNEDSLTELFDYQSPFPEG